MRYLLGVFAIVGMAIIAIILLMTNTPSSTSEPVKTVPGEVKMTSYSNQNAIVSLTTTGRLVGDSERRSIRVSVTPTERRIEVLSGYDNNVTSSQAFPNTQAGYTTFLNALDVAGFTKTKKTVYTSEKGVCPGGHEYIYDVAAGGGHPVHTWATNCSKNQGTFAGLSDTIRQLFQDQIPKYSEVTADVRL